MVFWACGAGINTSNKGPFKDAGDHANGYFATWIAFFASINFCYNMFMGPRPEVQVRLPRAHGGAPGGSTRRSAPPLAAADPRIALPFGRITTKARATGTKTWAPPIQSTERRNTLRSARNLPRRNLKAELNRPCLYGSRSSGCRAP